MEEQLVVFELNSEAYGINVTQVQSVIPMPKIISVPGVPNFIEGVVNLRGTVIPVVDLRHRFDLSQPANGQKNIIVIVELDQGQVGLIVDKVPEVVKIPDVAIEPPSSLLTVGVDNSYLRGIGKFKKEDQTAEDEAEKMVILLDLGRVFSLDEQQALVEAA